MLGRTNEPILRFLPRVYKALHSRKSTGFARGHKDYDQDSAASCRQDHLGFDPENGSIIIIIPFTTDLMH